MGGGLLHNHRRYGKEQRGVARIVIMVALAYNAQGRLIGIGTKLVENLDPGALPPFEIKMAPSSMAEEALGHFEILVEASLES